MNPIWPFINKQGGGPTPAEIAGGSGSATSMFQRVDQGWDLLDVNNGGGNVLAILPGTIHKANPDPGGFGNDYPYVVLDTPVPGAPSDTIYYGHVHMLSSLHDGDHVAQGDVIATTNKTSGQNGSDAPPGWLEIGFSVGGLPVGHGNSGATQAGQYMESFLVSAPTVNITATNVSALDANNSGGSSSSSSYIPPPATDSFTDPRDNRPFSPYFFGHLAPGTGGSGVNAGNFVTAGSGLVHGYMVSLVQASAGKSFACFFMMNPASLNIAYGASPDGAQPLTYSAADLQVMNFPTTGMTVSFDLIFNRMYEVWQGGYGGPSDIGARWDARALERLMGMYDVTLGANGSSLVGNYESGSFGPTAMPIQLMLGGPNSVQFAAIMQSLSVVYTIFDRNMVPIEAQCSVSLNRIFWTSQTDISIAPSPSTFSPISAPVTSKKLIPN